MEVAEEKPQEPEKTIATFAEFAERWMRQYVVANRLRDSTAGNSTVKGEVLILSKKGEPIRSSHPLRAWLRELQDELGLKRGVHILRHTFATQALHNGASLREVQALLGRTNIATTERYLHTDSDNLDQAMLRVARGRGATSAVGSLG